MSNPQPRPLVVHALPPAPEFVGRARELEELCASWSGGECGVIALVGLGGAGKTAIAARFLEGVLGAGPEPGRGGLFVWSFYREPDAGLFLREAYRYFAGDTAAASPARGAGLLHLLREALSDGARHLLVLDGLERVQQPGTADGDGFGRVEDPLLRGLLTRVAEGAGRATALITSRFPLTDLEPFRGRGYRPVDVGGLDAGSAVDLLRLRGVQGDDRALAELVESYGAHALTLDHLGGLISQFLEGDPRRAPEAPALVSPGGDRQALRLARLLRAYEAHLPPAELTLLCRVCLLRVSVDEAQLLRLFACAPPVAPKGAREAAGLIARLRDPGRRGGEEGLGVAVAGPALAAIEEALTASPLAGPADEFPHEVSSAVQEALAALEASDDELEAFVRLYEAPALDAPSARRPLPASDYPRLQSLIAAYRALNKHPLSPHNPPQHHDTLKQAFQKLGWTEYYWTGGWGEGELPEDVSPEGLAERYRRVERRLRRLAVKHAALVRVREVCRLRQQKWSLAGPLAQMDAPAVRRAVADLEGRHLLLREPDGSVGVHPAVRDHFARRGDGDGDAHAEGPGRGWHDLIREQLVSLVRRPGRGLPEDRAALDLVEEAIHHALEAGRADEAREVYEHGLGGIRHLGWKLGEMSRGLRVLRGFPTCPDPSALGWFLRALGEMDEAYRANNMPYFRADVRLLQGRLPEVAAEGDSIRTSAAAFLMGDLPDPPPDVLGLAVPRGQLLLFLGRLRESWDAPRLDRLYADIGWEDHRARVQLILAEVARRQADDNECRRLLEEASGWVLRSGSVEHLCLWHLVRCRAERDAGDLRAARVAADEGVHTARQCGLGLYFVLLLNARAEILLPADAQAAEGSSRESLAAALDPRCRFLWGASEAGHLLGRALASQWRFAEARDALAGTLALRERLGDPGVLQTRTLLARLPA